MAALSTKSVRDKTDRTERAEVAFRELVRVFGLLERIMQPYFSHYGISGSQWGVLRALHSAHVEGQPALRLTDLSDRLLVRPPSVTGVIDRLQRMGLVTRDRSTTDLRAKQVRLTDPGRELVERIQQLHPRQISSLMAGMDSAEQKLFHRLLARMSRHLETMAEGENRADWE